MSKSSDVAFKQTPPPLIGDDDDDDDEEPGRRLSEMKVTISSHEDRALEKLINKCEPSNMNLAHQEITDDDISKIIHLALVEKQSVDLKLGYNNITSHGIEILSNALRDNKSLQQLNLFNNRITDQGVFHLTEILSLNKSKINMLFLGKNPITDIGIKYLSEMLKTNQILIHLELADTEITDQGVILLADALAHHNTTLKELTLWGNKSITDICIDSVADMLVYNRTLEKLVLFDCNLSDMSKERLQEVIQPRNDFGLSL